MKETMSLLHSEWLKICSTKAFKVSIAFMLLLVACRILAGGPTVFI